MGMTGKQLVEELLKLSPEELAQEVVTEGCDCNGDVGIVRTDVYKGTMTSGAVRYAHLVGKYIRMERPAEEVELLELRASGDDHVTTMGMEGVVAAVWDSDVRVGGPAIEIMMDYGMGFAVFLDREDEWSFTIWPSEEVAKEIRVERKGWNL